MIEIDDFLWFADQTFDGFRHSLDRLDDETVNALPDLPAPNSPYQLVAHTVGALEWWTSHNVLGRESARDRPAEFTAEGTVAQARALLDAAQLQLHELAPGLAAATDVAPVARVEQSLGDQWTVGACLIHAYEEMAQHLGHLEITTDLLAPPD